CSPRRPARRRVDGGHTRRAARARPGGAVRATARVRGARRHRGLGIRRGRGGAAGAHRHGAVAAVAGPPAVARAALRLRPRWPEDRMTEPHEGETGRAREARPCRHMRRWVNALADGSLKGFARWYTDLHVAGCPKCRAALEALRSLRARLRALGSGA